MRTDFRLKQAIFAHASHNLRTHPQRPFRGCSLRKLADADVLPRLGVAVSLAGLGLAELPDVSRRGLDGFKIKNGDYSQTEGRGDLFDGPRQLPAHSAR
jgi:hypothetical protein